MKKVYILPIALLTLFLFLFCNTLNGQYKIRWEELPNLAKNFKEEVPEGKALFIFEGIEEFIFDSDNENINQPKKKGSIYKLLINIEPASGAVIIKHKDADNAYINYGKLIASSTLPALENREIKYFKLSLVKTLDYFDITNQKKKEGTTDFQGLTEKDALIILYVQPQNLDLQIDGSTTKVIKEEGRYKVYVLPEVRRINLKSKNYNDTPIDLENLSTKEVRYFRVQLPPSNIDVESFDPNTKVGNYLIETNPAGALIRIKGNPIFDKQNFRTPYTLEGFKASAEIITLELDRYETICDTIIISSEKGKKSNYNLIPKFAFLNCNIEPAIPTAKIFLDGNELVGIEDGKDFECLKGTFNVEITAPHFYPQTKQISLAAGQSVELNIKLRPKVGTITIEPGENANDAEVYINEKSIGKLPIQNYSLQEGEYIINYKKEGFVTPESYYKLNVNENTNTFIENVKMVNTKEVFISTTPVENVNIYIDDKLVGKSNRLQNIGVGKHLFRFELINYETKDTFIVVDQNTSEISVYLKPILIPFNITTKLGAKVHIDTLKIESFKTHHIIYLPEGEYQLKLYGGRERPAFNDKIRVPNNYTNYYPMYRTDARFLKTLFDLSTNFSGMEMYIYRFGIDGLTTSPLKLFWRDWQQFYSPFTNIEFKMGGALFRNLDFGFCANYDYGFGWYDNLDDVNDPKNGDYYLTKYFFGIELKTRAEGVSWFSPYFRIGIENANGYYQHVVENTIYPDKIPFAVKKNFLSVYLGFSIGTNSSDIFRLWHKPLFETRY